MFYFVKQREAALRNSFAIERPRNAGARPTPAIGGASAGRVQIMKLS
jgi:hypothetical protein